MKGKVDEGERKREVRANCEGRSSEGEIVRLKTQ